MYIRDTLGAPGWVRVAVEIYDNPELSGIPFTFDPFAYWSNQVDVNWPTSVYGERFEFGRPYVSHYAAPLDMPADAKTRIHSTTVDKMPLDGEIAYTRPIRFCRPSSVTVVEAEAEAESKNKNGEGRTRTNVVSVYGAKPPRSLRHPCKF